MRYLVVSLAFVTTLAVIGNTAHAANRGGSPNPGARNAAPSGQFQTQRQPSMPTQQLGPSRTGQPNQTCGSPTAPNTPGNAATAPGSAFNPGGNAGSVYAGQQPQNSRNSASVSQYDAACSHQP
jgi:hypothetical protein